MRGAPWGSLSFDRDRRSLDGLLLRSNSTTKVSSGSSSTASSITAGDTSSEILTLRLQPGCTPKS